MASPDPVHERPIDPPQDDPDFCDVFELDLWSPRASFGSHVMVARWPTRKLVWYWTAVVEEGRDLVTVVDLTVPLPRRGLELRAGGLWADHIPERPYEHWSVGLEAFALRIDDPTVALGDFRGERVPLGYDLEWELDPVSVRALPSGYEQPAVVHGEVLLGADTYDLDGFGWRRHTWGTGPLAAEPRSWGRGADGSARVGAVAPEATTEWTEGLPVPVGLPRGAEIVGWSLARLGADIGRGLWRSADAAGWCHVARPVPNAR